MVSKEFLRQIKQHNVTSRRKGEGEATQVADYRLIWKARGPETGYQFSIYEMVLEPGRGIDLHVHPYAEFFMVLEGEVSFASLDDEGATRWTVCKAGDSVNAPANAPHTFKNQSSESARFMSVSTYFHETMFINAGIPVEASGPATAAEGNAQEVFAKFVVSAEQAQVYVVEDGSKL
jgi:quercetin dioxygenase-like cupin family protein